MKLTVSTVSCPSIFLCLPALCLSISYPAGAQGKHPSESGRTVSNAKADTVADRARVLAEYGKLPLSFEANQGQSDGSVRFLSRGNGYTLFLTPKGVVMAVSQTSRESRDLHNPRAAQRTNEISPIEMKFLGANPGAAISGVDELRGKINYFIGDDPQKWHTGIPTYAKVNYKNIYPGIDLVYYGNQRQLEYDFVVAPGADPKAIRLKMAGVGKMRPDQNGDVVVRVGATVLRLTAPKVYQDDVERHAVAGRWLRRSGNELQFAIGPYDKTKTLVIDPAALFYSTYLGGSLTDAATGVAVDAFGDAYITGYTASGGTQAAVPFPTTSGAYQTQCNGCTSPTGTNNAFITELDPTGSFLVYSTFLGGNNGDSANGIAIDGSGDAYVVGTTFSKDFPTTNGAFQATCLGGCSKGSAFVTELNPSGSGLVFSTFLGGSTGKNVGNAIAVDLNGGIYVTGWTTSTDFPTQSPYQANCSNSCTDSDAFVTKFNPGGSAPLAYSTYLGGSGTDKGNGITVDGFGDAFVVGSTGSSDFPVSSAYQSTCGGCANGLTAAFVTMFDPAGTGLTYSTFLSGTQYPSGAAGDSASSVALDAVGDAYVTGSTTSTNFPTVNAFQSSCAGGCSANDAFVTKFDNSGQSLFYSTYLGGSGADQAFGIAVDSLGNAFVTGQTSSTDFPTPNSNYVFQSGCGGCAGGGHDAFVAEVNVTGDGLVYSSYLGGKTSQAGAGIAVNTAVNGTNSGDQAVIAGWTTSSINFPVTTGSFQGTFGGVEDAFISQFPDVANCTTTHTLSGFTVNATVTCTGNFVSGNQDQFVGFVWGDGATDGFPGCTSPCQVSPGAASLSVSHTYSTGSYTASPTVNDAAGASIVTVGFSVSVPATTPVVITSATLPGGTIGTAYTQTTLGASGGTPPYAWALASGSQPLPPGITLSTTGALAGTPVAAGIFNFTVQATDSNGLAASQGFSITVVPPAGAPTCLPPTVVVNSSGTNPLAVTATSNCTDSSGTIATTTINWGDGQAPSSGSPSSHTYANAGTYSITVTATDTTGLSDSASGSITLTAPVVAPVTPGQSAQQSTNVTAPLGVPSVTVTYQCTGANGPSGPQTMAYYNLSCTINGSGASATVTLTSTPTPIQITVQTNSSAAAELRRPGLRGIGSGTLYAAFLPLPGIALLGIGWSSKRRRKAGRYAGLALLGGLMLICVACGGGSSSTTTTTTTTTPAAVTPTGSYSVNVTGSSTTSGSSSSSSSSTITVGFSVSVG
jgi:hypothetical protein